MIAKPRPSRLIIADDHPVVRYGLINLLATEIDFVIASTCANGQECIQAIRDLTPDIALVDMSMPQMTGLEVLAAASAEQSATRIVFLAGAPEDREIMVAANGGAYGFVLKEAAADDLLSCLRCVARGEKWLPAALVDTACAREKDRQLECNRIEKVLSRREREVMLLIGESLSNKEAGRRLHLTEGTVKLHLHSIYSKLGLRNRTALAALAARYERVMDGLKGLERPRSGPRSLLSAARDDSTGEPNRKS